MSALRRTGFLDSTALVLETRMSDLIHYHAPRTRSTAPRMLLEELQAPYETRLLNLKLGDQRKSDYLAINPLGKVPSIVDKGVVVTEQVAIFIYLADAFPQAGLAPAIGDPLRGSYLRWLALYGSAFEPAMIDHAQKHDPESRTMSAYGSYDDVVALLRAQLAAGPYILGETFSAADILWGTALRWMVAFGLLEGSPEISAYVDRIVTRPLIQKISADDAALAAQQEAAAEAAQ
jgi:glutathione S-transferase